MNTNNTKFNPNTYIINENLSLRDYQLKLFEILQYYDKFCRDHNLTYYLCGGTCIGAVRHKGFIPWDCDIDVFMPRKDYEALENLWIQYADTDHYSCDRTTETNNMHAQVIGIKDNHTTYIRNHNIDYDMNHGIPIDVIPLDALSDKWLERQVQKYNGLLFSLFNAQRIPNQAGRSVKMLSKILLSIFSSSKRRYKIWKKAESKFSQYDINKQTYLGELTSGFSCMNLRYPKGWFEKPTELEFEGYYFYGPTEPEKYLETRYPGYMHYPPESEQLPKFLPEFIDINTPYIQYKGKKYCIDHTEGAG